MAQIASGEGEMSLYDTGGNLIYRVSTLSRAVPAPFDADGSDGEPTYISFDGGRYVAQERVSEVNRWRYVSVVRLDGVASGLASTQVIAILALVVLMLAAVFVILTGIVSKYRPISNLALTLTDPSGADAADGIIDEKRLLSSTIATLKSDSEQKQKLEAAYQEATEASRAKSTFLSNMSHDIRTPMNAIIGMTGIALKHADDADYVRECLSKVEVASRYLLDIINNVLDMSRIESGKIMLAEGEIDLPEMVHGIVTILRANVAQKRQRLIVRAESIRNEKALGDSVRLTQVCMNILSNAVKFTPEGGTITMTVRQDPSAQEDCGEYTLRFTDTGVGMSAEFQERVFDTFSRAQDSGAAHVEGTGLGMAIAKSIVDRMGGTIVCESEMGKGTTFTVALRLRLAKDDLDARLRECTRRCADRPMLIVGGDESQAALLAELGLRADRAADVTEAAAMAELAQREDRAYQYVFVNQTEGDRNGTAAAEALGGTIGFGHAKGILIAEDFMGIDQAASAKAGIRAFVRAPLFRSAIAEALSEGDASAKPREDAGVAANLAGKRVRLVEDNLMNREIARRLIQETGAEIVDAANGQEAVNAFAARPEGYFDVVLMDLQMPVMDGYQAAAAIRSMRRADSATVPIYAMTANTFDEDVRRVRQAGMDGHLGKPYRAEELFEVLRRATTDNAGRETQ